MMNYSISDEDAIKELIEIQHEIFHKDEFLEEDSIRAQACSIAIAAIVDKSYRIPKEIKIGDFDYGYCPSCGNVLQDDGSYDYCKFCGQALDWK